MRFRSILITICWIMCISIAIGLASSVWDKKPKAKNAKQYNEADIEIQEGCEK